MGGVERYLNVVMLPLMDYFRGFHGKKGFLKFSFYY